MTTPASQDVPRTTLEDVMAYFHTVSQHGIYGSIEVVFHGKTITLIRQSQTFHPGHLPKPSDVATGASTT